MEDFIARHPVFNARLHLQGYFLDIGKGLKKRLLAAADRDGPDACAYSAALGEIADRARPFVDFHEELLALGGGAAPAGEGAAPVVVVREEHSLAPEQCRRIKSHGWKIALESKLFDGESELADLADYAVVDFPSVSLSTQSALIRSRGHKTAFLARRVETWEDFAVARNLGYSLFQGYFFLWPGEGTGQREIKALDNCLVAILAELEEPEPSFRKISEFIEHDLGLSYRLLRLVNSAYMAPRYPISSISHALTYLGLRELHQWISMLLLGGLKSEENSELIKMSLIRGKLMALIAQELELPHRGSGPFFTGLFSMIDVILNKNMYEVSAGLPLEEEVKSALCGEHNSLGRLLNFVIQYEQAQWKKVDGRYPLDIISPERMVSLYLSAHRWAGLLSPG